MNAPILTLYKGKMIEFKETIAYNFINCYQVSII